MILTTAVAVAAAVGSPFAAAPEPTFPVDTYQLTVLTRGGFVRHAVGGPERFLTDPVDRALPNVLVRERRAWTGATATVRGRFVRARYQAGPDFDAGPDDFGLKLARFVVTEARAGRLTLTPSTMDARAVFRAEVDVPGNSCRNQLEGTAIIWLTRTTLLPRRLQVERDGKTQTWTYRYAGFNRAVGVLAQPALGRNPTTRIDGFRRTTPAAAGAPLPYVPRLPTVLPAGFRLVSSGWAPRGARTAVNGANKRDPDLFSAVYMRGWERIEITQRVASNGTWLRDPFSRACLAMRPGRILVGTRQGHYGIGPEIPSHLWWRDGPFLFTVAGPYSKRDLMAIAESLRPIT